MITETQKTLLSVLIQKIITYLEKHTMLKIAKKLFELITGLFLGVVLVAPDMVFSHVWKLATLENYAIVKLLFGLTLFFYRKSILKRFRAARQARYEDEEKFLDNIPVAELTDYLVRNKHFKREGANGVRETFGLNMERFNNLAKKLEENQVLIRGENNGRILASHWSRQTLFDYLSGEKKSVDLEPRFTVHHIGGKVRFDRKDIITV